MITRIFAPASIMGTILMFLVVGCGQPRLYFTTSTTVGVEATPPMSDGSAVPRVMLGYKRAEVAFIPVCPVERYKYTWSWLDRLFAFTPNNIKKCPSEMTTPASKDKPPKAGPQSQPEVADTSGLEEQPEPFRPPSTRIYEQGEYTKRQDTYSTLGLFRLGLSWFGPAKIEQFVATGQAARAIQESLPSNGKSTAKGTSPNASTKESHGKVGAASTTAPTPEQSGSSQRPNGTPESSPSTNTLR
jgi:hypothetical protein